MGCCGILVRRAWAELWRVPVEYANEGVPGFRQQGFSRLALEVGMEEGELRGGGWPMRQGFKDLLQASD